MLEEVTLKAYEVLTSVTCLHRPMAIFSDFDAIYGGSGKFEKYASSKVDSVEQVTVLLDRPDAVANPFNTLQVLPQVWITQLEVEYVKPYFHSSML